jgi:hypothetical protein
MKYRKIVTALAAAAALALPFGTAQAREPENFGRVFYKTGNITSNGGSFGGAFRASGKTAAIYYRCASKRNGQIVHGPQFNPNKAKPYPARCDDKMHRLSVPVHHGIDNLITMVLEQQGTGAISVWALK